MSALDDVDLSAVALFPLPGVVLFPRAVLPLHIFEERYKAMTADALEGDRVIAMALLRLGWEKNYYSTPEIEPVVCVGKILSHEKLADGKYNFLLQGMLRAQVVRELKREVAYRVAELRPLEQIPAMEIDLESQRRALTELFVDPHGLGATGGGKQFQQIVASYLPTADVADLAAFTFLEDANLKQSLLAETDVRRRVQRTIDALKSLRISVANAAISAAGPDDPRMN